MTSRRDGSVDPSRRWMGRAVGTPLFSVHAMLAAENRGWHAPARLKAGPDQPAPARARRPPGARSPQRPDSRDARTFEQRQRAQPVTAEVPNPGPDSTVQVFPYHAESIVGVASRSRIACSLMRPAPSVLIRKSQSVRLAWVRMACPSVKFGPVQVQGAGGLGAGPRGGRITQRHCNLRSNGHGTPSRLT